MAAPAKVLKQLIELSKQLGYEGEQLQTFVENEREAAEKAAEREREVAKISEERGVTAAAAE